MSLKKVNQDPFSNGTECMWWMERNCDRCVKSPSVDYYSYPIKSTKCRCSIWRDIEQRVCTDEPIAQRTIDICRMRDCPYRQEHWKQYKRKHKSKTAGLPQLFKEEQQ